MDSTRGDARSCMGTPSSISTGMGVDTPGLSPDEEVSAALQRARSSAGSPNPRTPSGEDAKIRRMPSGSTTRAQMSWLESNVGAAPRSKPVVELQAVSPSKESACTRLTGLSLAQLFEQARDGGFAEISIADERIVFRQKASGAAKHTPSLEALASGGAATVAPAGVEVEMDEAPVSGAVLKQLEALQRKVNILMQDRADSSSDPFSLKRQSSSLAGDVAGWDNPTARAASRRASEVSATIPQKSDVAKQAVGSDVSGTVSTVGSAVGAVGAVGSAVSDGLMAAGARSISITAGITDNHAAQCAADIGKGLASLTKLKNPLRVDDSQIEEKVSLDDR